MFLIINMIKKKIKFNILLFRFNSKYHFINRLQINNVNESFIKIFFIAKLFWQLILQALRTNYEKFFHLHLHLIL
jgi:hypothetical protein